MASQHLGCPCRDVSTTAADTCAAPRAKPTGRTGQHGLQLSPTARGSLAACASPLKPAAFLSLAGWITATGLLDGAAVGPEIAVWTYLGESVKLRLGPGPDQNS